MSDNTTVPGVGIVATDVIDSIAYQRVKLVDPTDGATTPLIGQQAMTGSIPVTLASDQTAIPVTGTFYPATQTVALDAASLAALESITVGGTIELGATSLAALEAVTAEGPLTDAQLRAVAVPVSGTFWQATQPVSGTVTVTEPDTRSGRSGFAITPNDTTTFAVTTRAIYVGGTGNVVVTLVDDGTTETTFYNVPVGTTLHVAATRVKTTSTATFMTGLS